VTSAVDGAADEELWVPSCEAFRQSATSETPTAMISEKKMAALRPMGLQRSDAGAAYTRPNG
jgi:hypothetical protein